MPKCCAKSEGRVASASGLKNENFQHLTVALTKPVGFPTDIMLTVVLVGLSNVSPRRSALAFFCTPHHGMES